MSADTQDIERVEVRCPQGPKNLLMKMRRDPDAGPPRVNDGNLLELACRDCTRHAKRQMQQAGLGTEFRILHLFTFDGEFVESIRESTARD